jgi:hypothetical protein
MSLFKTPKAALPLSHDLRISAKRAGATKGHGLLMLQAADMIDVLRFRISELELQIEKLINVIDFHEKHILEQGEQLDRRTNR